MSPPQHECNATATNSGRLDLNRVSAPLGFAIPQLVKSPCWSLARFGQKRGSKLVKWIGTPSLSDSIFAHHASSDNELAQFSVLRALLERTQLAKEPGGSLYEHSRYRSYHPMTRILFLHSCFSLSCRLSKSKVLFAEKTIAPLVTIEAPVNERDVAKSAQVVARDASRQPPYLTLGSC
jgi:hypothetical protein